MNNKINDTKIDDLLHVKTTEIMRNILAQREKIIRAFIAETGLLPSACEQVVQDNKWWVQKRTNG